MNAKPILSTLFGLAVACSSVPALAQDAAAQQGEYQGIPYLTGGVGLEEREQMLFASGDYNLKLGFAEKDGTYTSGTEVVVTDRKGQKVLEVIAQGPFVLARLPAGEYRVAVNAEGRQQVRTASVPAKGQRALMFYW